MSGFDFNQKISSHLALILVILVGFVMAWSVVREGQKIVDNVKNSDYFYIDLQKLDSKHENK